MAGTSGIVASTAALILTHINAPGTATGLTGPLKVLFLSASRSANNGTDTEWSTGGGYTAGTGFANGSTGLTFAAASATSTGATQASNVAATITNAPAGTWAGCRVVDSSATPKSTWYAPVTPSKTVNAGDTVTVPSGSFTTSLG